MLRSRILLIGLVCLVATAALPAAGLAQTAGADQYGSIAGVSEAGNTPSGEPAPAPAAEAPVRTAAAQPAPQAASPKSLPFTGADLLLMLLAGSALVGLGLALRTATRHAPAAS